MTGTHEIEAVRAALGPLADQAEALHAAMQRRGRSAVRINPLGRPIDPHELAFLEEPVAWAAGRAWWCAARSRPAADPRFGTGAYYVQDAGSLLPVTLLAPKPGELICDLCAAPGGKATAIAEALDDSGWLLANEAVQSRIGALRLNLARCGAARYAITNYDPNNLVETLGPIFDAVLVDAPCTGQSLLARGKAPRGAFDEKQIAHSAARQSRILEAAVRLLKPGGRLVYATCTFAWQENEARVIDLLERHPSLQSGAWNALQAYASPSPAPPGCYRLTPHEHGCQGAFAARLQQDDDGVVAQRDHGRAKPPSQRRVSVAFDEWGEWTAQMVFTEQHDQCFAWPQNAPAWVHAINAIGPEVAFRKGRTWFPAYALAMRRDGAFRAHARAPLDASDALHYLRGESIDQAFKGWAIATLGDRSLGWVKGDGRHLKNHLPKSARMALAVQS